ncbi:TetR/AcrR family transcriptional regulator [Nocardia vinacea]|uniref:TetR/AcrR family transcriptional regulator n=1 Tax=Nocardia vinacea TaxID=96468 RepID=UPI0002EF30D7|nr:TetR/AcrR family transcriptional regulator [Nocardia vinacea]
MTEHRARVSETTQVEETAQLTSGRVAQRRRTRKAIVDASMTLLNRGIEPSVNDIAAAADVSRRTVYLHFPTLDQLMLDATIGLLSANTDEALTNIHSADPRVRIAELVRAMGAEITELLPMGRRLVKLTVDPPAEDAPRHGHRRVRWIEWALEPLRDRMPQRQFDDLVSSIALVVGWEAFIVLIDVRGLEPGAAVEVCARAATTLVDAALRSLENS